MPDLPYIEISENTESHYRATHYPSGIELMVTWQADRPDAPYYVSMKQHDNWLSRYDKHCVSIEKAFTYLFESLHDVLETNHA